MLQSYAAGKFLDVLKSVPITRFADEAAARFISVTYFDRMPQWRWRTARWIVTCLFAPQEQWIDRPCIARALPLSQDADGSKTRTIAEKWRTYVASAIRSGMQEHLMAHGGQETPPSPRDEVSMELHTESDALRRGL